MCIKSCMQSQYFIKLFPFNLFMCMQYAFNRKMLLLVLLESRPALLLMLLLQSYIVVNFVTVDIFTQLFCIAVRSSALSLTTLIQSCIAIDAIASVLHCRELCCCSSELSLMSFLQPFCIVVNIIIDLNLLRCRRCY